MALCQLDAFEFRTGDSKVATVYQLLDDATRYDVGSWAYQLEENSRDAQDVLARAINAHGAPQEVLSDNSLAFNQLWQGKIGSVEIFLASKGTMPISGLPGKPTTQGKNERSHQTLQRFLEANKPHNLAELQNRIKHYREHYNRRRPHQSLNQATPQLAWEMLEHTRPLNRCRWPYWRPRQRSIAGSASCVRPSSERRISPYPRPEKSLTSTSLASRPSRGWHQIRLSLKS